MNFFFVPYFAEDNQFLEFLESEEKTQVKPTFSSMIKDVEVVEGSAARFDCKIEGNVSQTAHLHIHATWPPNLHIHASQVLYPFICHEVHKPNRRKANMVL